MQLRNTAVRSPDALADGRPLTARSVLASTLLGVSEPGPAALPVAYLVHMAGLFGINENRARVALSRMVASGEATTDGAGGYSLAGHLLDRQRRQRASRAGHTRPWGGAWHVVVVTTAGSTAEVRGRRRRALAVARLGELREGTWMRPDNLDLVLDDALAGDVTVLAGARLDDPAALAARLWDLRRWAREAEGLVGRLEARPPAGVRDLTPGFVLSASVLRHLQADPLVPEPLLPADWPGVRLRRVYDGWDARYRAVLARWSREFAPIG
ncbi:MAG TPA: PaaX family transcriptional regulator C-terminal domain-containing protein [Acidimicrobiales bacterium]|nr:PaaX family transcriptional regulator C-terminal domain-containing protein [Acidimicrobiales bacterium]